MRGTIRSAALGLALLLGAAAAPRAQAADEAKFKADLDAFATQLKNATHGIVTWGGADAIAVTDDNGTEVATITKPRIAIKPDDTSSATLTFDKFEMRRTPDADGKHAKLSLAFPAQSKLVGDDGTEVTLALKDATGSAVMEEPNGRVRESSISFAGARLEKTGSGDWINFGPLTASTKTELQPDGSWKAPGNVELKQIEFFLSEVPMSGAIDRIAYSAQTAGTNIATLDKVRDDLAALRQDQGATPEERLHDGLNLLPALMNAFSEAKGDFTVEGVAVRAANGQALVSVTKTGMGGALTGLAGDTAALRMTVRNEGLSVAASVAPEDKIPSRVVLDFGFENVGTAALRKMVEIASKFTEKGSDADQQKATQQLLGAAAMLNPTFRIYEFDVEGKDAGVEATAQTTGSPLAPKGYTADADVTLRGADALPKLFGDAPYIAYLPLLKELGTSKTAGDGSPRLGFHLASAPQKWLTLNGVDVTGWFTDDKPAAGQPRVLRPAEPPLKGNDVAAVQRALNAAKVPAPQDGVYTGDTAAAVARFQKQNGLNPDGVVTAATRDKLGLKPQPAAPTPEKRDVPSQGPGSKPGALAPAPNPPGWGHK